MAFDVMKNENTLSALYVTCMRIHFSAKGVVDVADYAHLIACVASVSVLFRRKLRTRNDSQRPRENPVSYSLFAPKQNGNACYAGYSPDTNGQTLCVFNNKE